MRRSPTRPPNLADELVATENAAAALFESRWTRQGLRRVDTRLDEDLDAQRVLFSEALGRGFDADIRIHGEAMIRGWQAAVRRMSDAGCADDAYLLGEANGVRVAISAQRAAEARVRERFGDAVVFLTPDEVAAMTPQPIAAVKALWPGAQVTKVTKKLGGLRR